jgi:carbonic anhydrase
VTKVVYQQTSGTVVNLPRDDREALDWLESGNRRFASLAAPDSAEKPASLVIEGDFGIRAVLGREPEPRPFGIVLGCADARVPIELVFGRAVNDLFVVRVAGNSIGADAMGSIEYAVEHFPTVQLVLVLGHTLCGAVAAAVDAFLKPRRMLDLATTPELRSLVDRVQVSVRVAAMALEEELGSAIVASPAYSWALLDLAVFLNAAYVAYCTRAALPASARRLAVVYGVYDLKSRHVCVSATATTPFSAPPDDADGFRRLARALARGPRILDLFQTEQPHPPLTAS